MNTSYQDEINDDLNVRQMLLEDEYNEIVLRAINLPQWAKLSIPRAKRTNWRTPAWLVEKIKQEFAPDIDVAADQFNTVCDNYFDELNNALKQDWHKPHEYTHKGTQRFAHGVSEFTSAWCNPPFDQIEAFLKQAHEMRKHMQVVMLLPYRAGTRWFRDLVFTPLFNADSLDEARSITGEYYYGWRALAFHDPTRPHSSQYFKRGELRILTKRLAFDDGGSVAAFDCCIVVLNKVQT